jgi:N-acetylglucosaminyldiphosphoundecaprenol N-acetyl-beta-D-mannosaminyltransferase
MVLPDGAPVALAASWIGRREAKQVSGSDVFDQICRGAGRRYRHFFYGSTEDVLSLLRRRVSDLYPGIDVVGTHSPPFRPLTEEERVEEAAMINAARPDIIWVGLGAPKQDLWMAANRAHLNAPVLVGVGAVFDFVSGRKRRAPEAMRAVGLEWLYRLLQEPRRLWRRYLVANTSFVLGVAFPVLRSRLSRPRR